MVDNIPHNEMYEMSDASGRVRRYLSVGKKTCTN